MSSVTDMNSMFINTQAFNQPISAWVVSNLLDTRYMFGAADVFDQPLNSWNVSSVIDFEDYDLTTPAWINANKPVF